MQRLATSQLLAHKRIFDLEPQLGDPTCERVLRFPALRLCVAHSFPLPLTLGVRGLALYSQRAVAARGPMDSSASRPAGFCHSSCTAPPQPPNHPLTHTHTQLRDTLSRAFGAVLGHGAVTPECASMERQEGRLCARAGKLGGDTQGREGASARTCSIHVCDSAGSDVCVCVKSRLRNV